MNAARIDAKRVVIYHHEAGQQIPGCDAAVSFRNKATPSRIP